MTKTLPVIITLQDLESLFDKHDERLETRILKEVRKIVKDETKIALKPYAKKRDLQSLASKQDLQEAVDAIMHGMEEMYKDVPTRKEVVLKTDIKNLYA